MLNHIVDIGSTNEMTRSLQKTIAVYACWIVGLALLATPSAQAITDDKESVPPPELAPPAFDSIGVLSIKKSGIAIPVPALEYSCTVGQRLRLLQENRLYYIAETETVENGRQMCAFTKVNSHGRGNAWVTAEQILIFGRGTESVPGLFYLQCDEELPIIEASQNAYQVLVQRDQAWAPILVPRELPGTAFNPPTQKKAAVAKRKITKIRSYELTEQGPVLKRESIRGPTGELTEDGQSTRKAKVLEMKGRKVTVLSPELLESDPPSSYTYKDETEESFQENVSEGPDTSKPSWFATAIAPLVKWWTKITSHDKKESDPEATALAEAEPVAEPTEEAAQKPNTEKPDTSADFTVAAIEPTPFPETEAEAEAEPVIDTPSTDLAKEELLASLDSTGPLSQPSEEQKSWETSNTGKPAMAVLAEGFKSNKMLLTGILATAVGVLAILLLRLQRKTGSKRAISSEINTYFTVGETEAGPEQSIEHLAQESGDFSGSLSGFSIIELIHFLNSGKETGTLAVKDDTATTTGRLYFSNGELLDAASKKLRGEDAVDALLKGQNSSFKAYS